MEKNPLESDPDFSQTTVILNNLGLTYAEQKKFKEAEETHRRAITLREKYDPPPHRNLAASLVNLGKVFYDQAKYLEAESLFQQAQKIYVAIGLDDATGEDVDVMLMNSNNLALIAGKRRAYREAENRYLMIIRVTELKKGRNHPDLIGYLTNYAELLRATKRLAAARKSK